MISKSCHFGPVDRCKTPLGPAMAEKDSGTVTARGNRGELEQWPAGEGSLDGVVALPLAFGACACWFGDRYALAVIGAAQRSSLSLVLRLAPC